MIKKQLYEAPATEVLELRLEGTVLTGSEDVYGTGLTIDRGSALEDGGEW